VVEHEPRLKDVAETSASQGQLATSRDVQRELRSRLKYVNPAMVKSRVQAGTVPD